MRRSTSRAAILLVILPAALAAGCRKDAAPPAPPSASKPAHAPDAQAQYAAALGAASDFCHAWRHHDLPAAEKLMTPAFRVRHPRDVMHDAIGGSAGPLHTAADVLDGRRVADGHYVFGVRLYLRYLGQMQDRTETAEGKISVLRQPDGKWLIDEFPVP